MYKKEGKVYDGVKTRLKERGLDTDGLEVYCTNRGAWHYVIINGETIGEYNHVSKRLSLYTDPCNYEPPNCDPKPKPSKLNHRRECRRRRYI